jgi:hypothetical protein
MRDSSLTEQQRDRLRAHAHHVRLTARHLRWRAAQVRRRAALIWLARHMPDANPLTVEVASAILRQHRLWPGARPPASCPIRRRDASAGGDLAGHLATA